LVNGKQSVSELRVIRTVAGVFFITLLHPDCLSAVLKLVQLHVLLCAVLLVLL